MPGIVQTCGMNICGVVLVTLGLGLSAMQAATVTLTTSDASAAERLSGQSADLALFTITRNGSVSASLSVQVAYGGTAINGIDNEATGTTVFIPAGQSSATIAITAIDDSLVEGLETISITLQPSANYTIGSPASTVLSINDNDNATPATSLNIPFASHPNGSGTQDIFLNVYLPGSGTGPWPVIIWYPGGAFQTQNQSQVSSQLVNFTADGYAVVSANYIDSRIAVWPAQIQDAKAAVRWVRANAATYGFDATRIGVTGNSSGGHIASYIALTGGAKTVRVGHEVVDLVGSVGSDFALSDAVACCVPFYGTFDLLQTDHYFTSSVPDHDAADSPESVLIGAAIQTMPDRTATAHPLLHVSAGAVPFWITHGMADTLLPFHESELLNAALVRSGVPVTFWPVENGQHGIGVITSQEVFLMVHKFFDKNLKQVSLPPSPVPSFTMSAGTGNAPLTVSCDGSASTAPAGTIAGFAWSHGEDNGVSGPTMTHTFTKPGVYPISLAVHDDKGGSASLTQFVTVTPASVGGVNAPSITWAGPSEGTLIARPGNIVAKVQAAAATGSRIVSVGFYLNNVEVALDTVAPYAGTLGSLAPGRYTIMARANDDAGRSAVTNSVTFRVLAPDDAEMQTFISGSQFGFIYNRLIDGMSYTFERSTDLIHWQSFAPSETMLIDYGGVQVRQMTDPVSISGVPSRFVRLKTNSP